MITLVAREPLTYAGRDFQAGDVFEAIPIDAATLTYKRRAKFAEPGTELTPDKPARGRYRRRDLRPEE
jgi:hypothetical protein